MERKLQERMVGASVLIIALVIIGPMLLDHGFDDRVAQKTIPGQRAEELRTHTFRLNESRAGQGPAVPPVRSVVPTKLPAPVARVEAEFGHARANAPPASASASAEPKGEAGVVQSPAKTPGARPAEPRGAGDWVIQVGTFGQKANAVRLVASLKKRGFAAFMTPITRAGKTLYRVRVGPPGSREAAAGVASRLEAAGQTGQIVTR